LKQNGVKMKRFVVLYLALIASGWGSPQLATASRALAQQPTDWRPSIAEDNKAATWENTTSFVTGMLNDGSSSTVRAKENGHCRISFQFNPAVDAAAAAALYGPAYGDYMAGKFGLARSEFSEVIRKYPLSPIAGNSYFYTGEIEFRAGEFAAAIKDYDHVIDQFPDYTKIPLSHYHKALALRAIKENDAAIGELRVLVRSYPQAPETQIAKSQLKKMGEPITASGEPSAPKSGSVELESVEHDDDTTVDFSRVDPLTIVVRGSMLYLGGTNGQPITISHDGKPVEREITLSGRDADSTRRLARALMHAALLCGGTKAVSPF
jgi:TolA-binding protein